jgi:hypothetical protein
LGALCWCISGFSNSLLCTSSRSLVGGKVLLLLCQLTLIWNLFQTSIFVV